MKRRVYVHSVVLSCMCLGACGLVADFERLEFFDPTDASIDVVDAAPVDAGADVVIDQGTGADGADGGDGGDGGDAGTDAAIDCYERLDGSFDGGAILFCDDFERDSGATDGWGSFVAINGGTLETSDEMATNGTRSLVVSIPSGASAGEKQAYVRTKTVSVTPVIFEYDFRLDVGPPPSASYPSNAFTIGRATALSDSWKATFIRVEAAGQLDPIFNVNETPMPFAQVEWLHMKWSLLGTGVNMQTIEVHSKSNPGTVITRTANGHAPKDFWVGALTGTNLGPVRLFVDAVVVHQ